MLRLLFSVWLMAGFLTSIAQPHPIAGEYYIGNFDPGVGEGKSFATTDSSWNLAIEQLIAQDSIDLPEGSTLLFNARLKDIRGNWGPVFKKVLFISSANRQQRQHSITQAEFFLGNSDPGAGSGTPLLVYDGAFNDAVEIIFKDSIILTAPSDTFSLCMRVKDQSGNWGPLFKKTIFKPSSQRSIRTPGVQSAEYYFGLQDPGLGNAFPLLFYDGELGQSVSSLKLDSLTTASSRDTTVFNIRVKDGNNNWGAVFRKVIFRTSATQSLRGIGIQSAEYFLGLMDPGQGQGTPLIAFDGNFGDAVESIKLDSILVTASQDTARFNIRLQDSRGNWGSVFSKTIFKSVAAQIARNAGVQQAEYFIGSFDPGQGQATPLIAFDGNFGDAVEAIRLDSLYTLAQADTALFNIRVKGASGNWGPLYSKALFINTATAESRALQIQQAEYFIGRMDPGEQQATPILWVNGDANDAIRQLIKDSIVSSGSSDTTLFQIRLKDGRGNWGPTFKKLIFKNVATSNQRSSAITLAEWFTGNQDPGEGNGLPMLVFDGQWDDALESIKKDSLRITLQQDTLLFNVRLRDASGNWGPLFKKVVFVDQHQSVARSMSITEAEYYFGFFDPGEGNGTPFLSSDGNYSDVVEQLLRIQATWDIPASVMLFNVRVKDAVGNWGPIFKKTVFINGENPTADLIQEGDSAHICPEASITLRYKGPAGYDLQWFDGSTSPTLTFYPQTAGYYRVSASLRDSYYEDSIYIGFLASPPKVIQPSGNVLVCASSNLNLSATNDPQYSYQWRYNGINIVGSTSYNYLPTQVGTYSVFMRHTQTGCTRLSDSVKLATNGFAVSAVPNTTNCLNGTTLLEVPLGSTNTYQWQFNNFNVSGATQSTYRPTSNGNYRVIIRNGSCTFTTPNYAYTLGATSNFQAVMTPAQNQTICEGQSVQLKSNTGIGYTYQWKRNGINIPFAFDSIYTATQAGVYTVVVINNNQCTSESNAFELLVSSGVIPTAQIAGTTQICAGQSAIFNAIGTNLGVNPIYTWMVNGGAVQVGNSFSFTIADLQNGAQVSCMIRSFAACRTQDEVVANELNVSVQSRVQSTISITACDQFTWNGIVYTQSGSYTYQSNSTSSCDSNITLVLMINRSANSFSSQTACNSYTWFGTTYSNSGTYTRSYTNGNGCPSVDTLYLTINNGTFSSTSQSACNNYTWFGTTYTNSGTYTRSYTNGNGCPLVDTLFLTINRGTFTSTSQTACNSYTWFGTTYSNSGTYTHSYNNGNGCASVDTLYLTINRGTFSSISQTACGSYTWFGTTYSNSGTYTRNYNNGNGCPSVDTLYLTINNGTFSSTTQSACNSYTWFGTTYSNSGTYTRSYNNGNGCASVDTLYLTINNGTFSSTTQTACGSYTWLGTTYSNSGTYTRSYNNANGCASVDTLYLTINRGTFSSTSQSVCNNYTWFGMTYTNSGTYTRSYTNGNGCPSVDTLFLTINRGTFTSTSQTACNSYTWFGTTYSNSGTYTHSYNNGNGCASVDTLYLTINRGTFSSTTQSACNSYIWFGTTYSNSGTYTRSYNNGNGCPSVDTLYLTINNGTFSSTTQTACNSYTWFGTTYSNNGTYTRSYNNANGCPSVDTLYLTINNGTFNSTTQTACGSYSWFGTTYSNSGTYTRNYNNVNGCASVDTLRLTITAEHDYYWIGGVSSAWEEPANWSCGMVPNAQSNVYVQNGAQRSLEVRSQAVCNRLYLRDGKTVRVNTGYRLRVLSNP